MAKNTLPTNFKDDILNSSMNSKRKYNMIQNTDGTVSLEDASTYDQIGSEYGASQVNATNKAVNESADAGKIIDDVDDINAVTEKGYIAGALALKALNSSLETLGGFTPVIDESTGQITGYTTTIGGADTVFPFKNSITRELVASGSVSLGAKTVTINVKDKLNNYNDLTVDNFGFVITNISYSRSNNSSGGDYTPVTTSYQDGIYYITTNRGDTSYGSCNASFNLYVYH